MTIAAFSAGAAVGGAGRLAFLSSWGESRIWCRGGMTIPAPEPDLDVREPTRDHAAGSEPAADGGVVVPLSLPRDDRPVFRNAAALPAAGRAQLDGSAAAARRLRLAAPVQLELVSAREGPGPGVVWASLPEHSREAVLVVLARLIGSGAIDEPAEEPRG